MKDKGPWSWDDLTDDEQAEVEEYCKRSLVSAVGRGRDQKLAAALVDLVLRNRRRRELPA